VLETARGEAVRCTVVVSALGGFLLFFERKMRGVYQGRKLFCGEVRNSAERSATKCHGYKKKACLGLITLKKVLFFF